MAEIKNQTRTLSVLRSLGKNIKCLPSDQQSVDGGDFRDTTNGILNVNHLDVESADKISEDIISEDDFFNAFFLAPLTSHIMLEDEDNDGEIYWSKMKPKLIERLNRMFGLRYGIDFTILRRGYFSLLVILTKDEDGDWSIPDKLRDAITPNCSEVLFRNLSFYYRNTDVMFFPINAITAANKMSDGSDYSIKDKKNIAIEGVQVDITFLRSSSFRETDEEEDREHTTYHIFLEGILHSLALEYRILTFDDEIADSLIGDICGKICMSGEDDDDD